MSENGQLVSKTELVPKATTLLESKYEGKIVEGTLSQFKMCIRDSTDIRGDILELSVVVMQGENVKLDVVSNAKGTYNNDFETNNTAFGAETGIVTYTIDTSGISFAK